MKDFKTTSGTNHFQSISRARRYYQPLNLGMDILELTRLIEDKRESGEIAIGPPQINKNGKTGQVLFIDTDGRYHIQEC